MESLTGLISKTKLFQGLSTEEAEAFLEKAEVHRESFKKKSVIICEGDANVRIGVILQGSIVAERVLPDGEVLIASKMGAGGVLGDVLSGSSAVSPVTVIAAEDTEILFFSIAAFIEPNAALIGLQLKLTKNLILDISDKYFELEKRVAIMSAGALRRRILLYLCGYCPGKPKQPFDVPHTRAQQAAYLGCERSALSRELSKMREDGIIDYDKNSFSITDGEHNCRKDFLYTND